MSRRLLLGIHALALLLLSFASGMAFSQIVVVVSPRSSVTALSANQVADIFLGKVNRFPDGTQVVPIDQAEDSPARDMFYSQFTGKSSAQVKSHWSKIIFTGRGQPPKQASNSSEVKKQVGSNPNAIGYIDQSVVDASVKVISAAE